MRHSNACVADTPELQHFHGRGSYGRRDGRCRGSFSRNHGTGGYKGNRPLCATCNYHHYPQENCHHTRQQHPTRGAHHRGKENDRATTFHHTVSNAELCNAKFNAADGAALPLCADSGTTHVVTADASILSDYQPLSGSEAEVKLASEDATCSAVGYGVLTLRSRATHSTLSFSNALHVPTARRTLICFGKALRAGVFWHFDSRNGGYIEVEGKGYWCDIVLASNDLLFLVADIVYPSMHSASAAAAIAPTGSAELSNAELYHRRLGHPGRTATEFIAAKGLIPKDAAASVSDHCFTCLTCKGKDIPRQNLFNPSTRLLEK
jgi:hypothetical protein